MKTMTDFDPIRTVYDHLSGRQPVALMVHSHLFVVFSLCLFFFLQKSPSTDEYSKFFFFNLSLLLCFLSQTTDDWQRNLAAMVANPPRQHPKCVKKNMTCLGDTLRKFTVVLTGESFPTFSKKL